MQDFSRQLVLVNCSHSRSSKEEMIFEEHPEFFQTVLVNCSHSRSSTEKKWHLKNMQDFSRRFVLVNYGHSRSSKKEMAFEEHARFFQTVCVSEL